MSLLATRSVPVRRLRRSPHLTEERQWLWFHRFALDMETGIGVTTGQGADPQVMLRTSEDGGHTWGGEVWTSAGAIGVYKHRAVWRRLGRSRNRVFEVSFSDPCRVVLVDAYLDVGA